jgi:V-type H+-transporting ATPase subunit H
LNDLVKSKAMLHSNLDIVKTLLECLASMQDTLTAQWLATLLYDMLREDAGCFTIFEDALKQQSPVYKLLAATIARPGVDSYVADKSAWVLTAIIGNSPRFFSEEDVKGLVDSLQACQAISKLGFLEAMVNLLKADLFRSLVWSQQSVSETVLGVDAQNAPSPYLYKCVFAIWMLSFSRDATTDLKGRQIVHKMKEFLTTSRVEKVVRLCLTVIRNFLADKQLCEDIVENGVLEVVQQLEFEKWRDAELYDDIREVASLISTEVNEMSNFDRYERELQSGKLKWGFIHSTKFWAENVMKFESNDFRALKTLATLLNSADATTLAVACHDVGEFVALHPLGKKQAAKLGVKERVMQLMSSESAEHREVRREALLCCQKIMLNKWQDLEVSK